MVEAAPQMVKNFADDQGHNKRRMLPNLNPTHALTGLRVLIMDDAIWLGFEKDSNPLFKITDVVFGPFDFCPDSN